MTLISDLRRMSRNSPYTRILNSLIPRSQSDSSQTSLAAIADKRARRGSDWSESMAPMINKDPEVANVVLRPLQLNNGGEQVLQDIRQSGLFQRRLSKGVVTSKSSSNCTTETSSKNVTRSHSVKSIRKPGDSRRRYRGSSIPSDVGSTCTGAKVQQRTISNRSLPLPGEESDYTRLRNFSTTSKGIVNRGDSFRSKMHSVLHRNVHAVIHREKSTNGYSPLSDCQFTRADSPKPPIFRVRMIGLDDVGKTSIKNQFMTSEYICAYDNNHDEESDKAVTIVLNNEESQLEFEEESLMDDNFLLHSYGEHEVDAFVVVYSVANRRSFLRAKQLLYQLVPHDNDQKFIVILVGNKNDLARLRTVTTEEGRSLAQNRGCKFIETSVAINHQVDELLVGILTQIKMKSKMAEKKKKDKRRDSQSKTSSICSGSKASGVLKKILQRACLKSASCDNLHVL